MKKQIRYAEFDKTDVDFDSMCELAARAASAPAAMITRLAADRKSVAIWGHFGTNRQSGPRFANPLFDVSADTLIAVPDIDDNPAFADHPLRALVPKVKSVIYGILQLDADRARTTLSIYNAEAGIFACHSRFACLSELVIALRRYLALQKMLDTFRRPHLPLPQGAAAFQEPANLNAEPTAKFLLGTLVQRRTLRSRKNASYVAVRTWNKTIKDHQIAALSAIKQFPSVELLGTVSAEIADTVRHLYGEHTIGTVVPVPCGSSGSCGCLSVKLAQAVAHALDCDYVEALQAEHFEIGPSHPRKSSRLKPYRLAKPVSGVVLLVDDVATSGRHIELAQQAIRDAGATCYPIAWIGN